MTLIVTALADDATVQVSDRRLTDTSGRVVSEHATKAICFDCADARVSIGYTGLARIGTTPVDHWLVDLITDNDLTSQTFPKAVERISELATDRFKSIRHLGEWRRLSLVFCGFGPPGPVMALVSNSESSSGEWLDKVSETFVSGFWLRNGKPVRKLDVMINGTEAAVSTPVRDALRRIRERFLTESPESRVRVLVQLLRLAADDPKFGRSIGRECAGVVVNADGGVQTTFHSEGDGVMSYAPHYVKPGMAFKDIWISTDESRRPPWAPPRR